MTEHEYRIKKLTDNEEDKEYVEKFKNYCIAYGVENDESFTAKDEMEKFKIDDENPTYLLLDEKEELVGAASLMLTGYFLRGNRGRFRILHTKAGDAETYKLLIDAVKPHLKNLSHAFLFMPLKNEKICSILDSFDLEIERYVYYMERELNEVQDYSFPEGFLLKDLQFGKDEHWWCKVRNEAFSNLIGSNTPLTEMEVSKIQYQEDHLAGGLKLLWHNEEAVGAVGIHIDIDEDENFANIGPIAVLEGFRGQGMGRNLLRAGLRFAKENGYKKAGLSVNAENSSAAKLYTSEGFHEVIALACYQLKG